MNEILATELVNHHFCTFNLESHYTLSAAKPAQYFVNIKLWHCLQAFPS